MQKGSTKVGGLGLKRSSPPLSKIRIKHYERSGKLGVL